MEATANNQGQPLNPSYENGQSDIEKLMRRHLQEPGHVITDEDLKNIKVGTNDTASVVLSGDTAGAPEKGDDNDDTSGPDRIITPLNVLGG